MDDVLSSPNRQCLYCHKATTCAIWCNLRRGIVEAWVQDYEEYCLPSPPSSSCTTPCLTWDDEYTSVEAEPVEDEPVEPVEPVEVDS
jgi:hypothetical protein